jgi:hypothetical protein
MEASGMTTKTSILDNQYTHDYCQGDHPKGGECGEEMENGQTECHVCGTPAVWVNKGSKKYRLAPKDDKGRRMLKIISKKGLRITYFRNAKELHRWERIAATVPMRQVVEITNQCCQGKKGYAALNHTLNALDYLIMHDRVEQTPEITEDTIVISSSGSDGWDDAEYVE